MRIFFAIVLFILAIISWLLVVAFFMIGIPVGFAFLFLGLWLILDRNITRFKAIIILFLGLITLGTAVGWTLMTRQQLESLRNNWTPEIPIQQ
ncbi:MAG TPA: hypothetical protein VJK04_02120 [Candidatus Paceibacterota bacterium]